MKFSMKATIPIIVATSLCIPLQSHAYLGGFESADGYLGFVNWVNGYNAGQYGTANGGSGGPNQGPNPPTADFTGGLWNDTNDAFPTYYANGFVGGYYVTGHTAVPPLGMVPHSGNQMLALRNTTYAATTSLPATPLDYSYSLDTRDFYNGGNPVAPTATGNKIVDWSVWAAPGPVTAPNDGLWLTFRDSAGNIGFQFGYDTTYELRYRDGTNPLGSWTNAGHILGRPWASGQFPCGVQAPNCINVIYDRLDFSLDLLNDTWSLDVLSGVDGTTKTLVSNMAFGQSLLNFTEIDWHVSYGNEKGFFDDSAFVVRPAQVPEPGTFAMVALGGLLLWRTHAKNRGGEALPAVTA